MERSLVGATRRPGRQEERSDSCSSVRCGSLFGMLAACLLSFRVRLHSQRVRSVGLFLESVCMSTRREGKSRGLELSCVLLGRHQGESCVLLCLDTYMTRFVTVFSMILLPGSSTCVWHMRRFYMDRYTRTESH